MAVIGVLGHTDHGKSTLLEKLTGVNPMHLPEEKARGLTIQLGFAFLSVAPEEMRNLADEFSEIEPWRNDDSFRISFIDVPGHERFLRNMLRGVLSIDGAMLLVAADDGIMPGTIQHLRASLYSGINHGLIVITKIDLVSPDRVLEVEKDVRQAIQGTFWEKAEIIRYSSANLSGFDELKKAIILLGLKVEKEKKELPFSYYFVDRVFSATGVGTVVTGTLFGRQLNRGEELYHYPSGKKVKVRALEQGGVSLEKAPSNFRTALNLSGIKAEEVEVGDLFASQSAECAPRYLFALLWEPTPALSPKKPFEAENIGKYEKINLFIGSRLFEVAKAVISDLGDGFKLCALLGDFQIPLPLGIQGIIYRQSIREVAIGGTILPLPLASRLAPKTVGKILAQSAQIYLDSITTTLSAPERIAILGMILSLCISGFVKRRILASFSLIPEEVFLRAFDELAQSLPAENFAIDADLIYSKDALNREILRLKEHLVKLKEREPFLASVALSKVAPQNSILSHLSEQSLKAILESLGLAYREGSIHFPIEEGVPVEYAKIKGEILARFRRGVSEYPTLTILRRDFPTAKKLINLLLSAGEIVHLGNGVLITGKDFTRWAEFVIGRLQKEEKIVLGEVKDALNISRKYLIPFLETMDSLKITARAGEVRVKGVAFERASQLIAQRLKKGE